MSAYTELVEALLDAYITMTRPSSSGECDRWPTDVQT